MEICGVIVMGLNSECWGYVESIYPGGVLGLLSKTQDEVWDFFEKLAWDTYAFEQAKYNFGYPTPDESVFHANPYPYDHFMNSHDPSYSCCLMCYVIIVNLLIMMFVIAHIVVMLMLNVQVWKRRLRYG